MKSNYEIALGFIACDLHSSDVDVVYDEYYEDKIIENKDNYKITVYENCELKNVCFANPKKTIVYNCIYDERWEFDIVVNKLKEDARYFNVSIDGLIVAYRNDDSIIPSTIIQIIEVKEETND